MTHNRRTYLDPPKHHSFIREGVHMLDELADEEVDHFLKERPRIVPLFEVDGITTIASAIAEAAMGV